MDNPLNIMLIGASGKLAKEIESVAKDLPTFHITERVTRSSPHLSNLTNADIVLDASSPEALEKNLKKIVDSKKPLVIASTGHSEESIKQIHEASKHIPILLCANLAPGIIAINKMIESLPEAKNVEIKETHHASKKDAPSGTAKKLAKLAGLDENSIAVVREGSVIGHHWIKLDLEDETIEVSHKALSRTAFAKGALLACQFLSKKGKGLYTSYHD